MHQGKFSILSLVCLTPSLTALHLQRFDDVEHELQVVAQAQGSTIDRCLEMVRMNKETMDMMRVRSILSAVMLSMLGCVHLVTHSPLRHNRKIYDKKSFKM